MIDGFVPITVGDYFGWSAELSAKLDYFSEISEINNRRVEALNEIHYSNRESDDK